MINKGKNLFYFKTQQAIKYLQWQQLSLSEYLTWVCVSGTLVGFLLHTHTDKYMRSHKHTHEKMPITVIVEVKHYYPYFSDDDI